MIGELIYDLVSIYSPSEEEAEAVRYFVDWMAAHDFRTQVDPVGNAIGERGNPQASQMLLLLGHIDTVPGYIPVHVEDDNLYGRGSVDAKGSLCAFAEAAARATIPPDWRVMVVGAVGEETSSRGAYYLRDRLTPTCCIIGEPSGAGRLTLGYKGHMTAELTLSRPLVHSARPQPSVGEWGVDFWQAIKRWAQEQNVGTSRVFDQVSPHLTAINTQADGFHDTLQMVINFRLPPTVAPEDMRTILVRLAEPDATLRTYSAEPAYLAEKNTPLVRAMLAAIRAQGDRPGFVLKSGTSDMNVVGEVWTCPMVAYGPGDSNLDHTPDEHLSLHEYRRSIDTLQHLIQNL